MTGQPDGSPVLLAALADVQAFASMSFRERNRFRREAERTIQALITVLDHLDADPDLEPEEDACAARDDFGGLSVTADHHVGEADDAEPEEDRCTAMDDCGGLPLCRDGRPGDPDDIEPTDDMEPDFDSLDPAAHLLRPADFVPKVLPVTSLFRKPAEA